MKISPMLNFFTAKAIEKNTPTDENAREEIADAENYLTPQLLNEGHPFNSRGNQKDINNNNIDQVDRSATTFNQKTNVITSWSDDNAASTETIQLAKHSESSHKRILSRLSLPSAVPHYEQASDEIGSEFGQQEKEYLAQAQLEIQQNYTSFLTKKDSGFQ